MGDLVHVLDKCKDFSNQLNVDLCKLQKDRFINLKQSNLTIELNDFYDYDKPEVLNNATLILNELSEMMKYCEEFDVPASKYEIQEKELFDQSISIIESGLDHIHRWILIYQDSL